MSWMQILETLLIGPLKLIFELIFVFANRLVGDPGWSIIALSMAMNILVLPMYRQADAVQEKARDIDAKLHDGVTHIKKTFSGDERMMILQTYYRQNHYKPTDALNGSVSLLLEVPFFMAAYQFLSNLEILQSASFGPIRDLGMPDGMLVIGTITLNLLPILMTLVNVISSALYLKGYPLKTKVQLYAMAGFFLVFLYESPSGLVLYWTLNNVFSLVKTIFYKLKNPRKVLRILCSGLGALVLIFGAFVYMPESFVRKMFVICIGLALQLPAVLAAFRPSNHTETPKPNAKLFTMATVFMTLFMGLLIPSTLIAASPLEFVNIYHYHNPMWYLVSSCAMAAGTFLVWMRVFYWMAGPGGKVWFERILWMLCGIALINYMFFGTDLGIISPDLQFEQMPSFTAAERLINIAAVALTAIVLYIWAFKNSRSAATIALTLSIAVGTMSGAHVMKIHTAVESSGQKIHASEDMLQISLSKSDKNVVVLMLDRACGQFLPYIFSEKPQLQEQFQGFTHYANTISFGPYTNFGTPALLGGYEYTPVEMNRRDGLSLESKHNEALKVMPALFYENGYSVTVCDPVYAGYDWIPDLSIFDEYPEMKTYNTDGMFTDAQQLSLQIQSRHRNFFCFSLMKTMPLVVQLHLYQGGRYNQAPGSGAYTIQLSDDISVAEGVYPDFYDQYNVLVNLPELTTVGENIGNTFLFLCNDLPHVPMLLQAPDYTPSLYVDNAEYDEAHQDRFTIDGESLNMHTYEQMSHYHANMAALIQVGNWLDYLRQEGVYDNTRIILVADHGRGAQAQAEMMMGDPENPYDVAAVYPLLMMKDFGSDTYCVSYEFMTNADVPSLASQDLIQNPVNPFTGKQIDSSEKTAHSQYIILSDKWDVEENNGTTYLPAQWASVSADIRDPNNWRFYNEQTVLHEHAFP